MVIGAKTSSHVFTSRFLKNHNLYELVAVKDKIGDDGKWHPLEFRCLECNAVQTASTGSLSNLRRHMSRMHMARINDYEEAWSKQRGARRSSKILYQARVIQIWALGCVNSAS